MADSNRAKDDVPMPGSGGAASDTPPPIPTTPKPSSADKPPMPTDAGKPEGEI